MASPLRVPLLYTAVAALSSLAAAQPPAGHWGPPPPGTDGYGIGGFNFAGPPGGRIGNDPNSGGPTPAGFAPGFGRFGFGSDFDTISHARLAHGVLASLAFVFFFPVGAIFVRALPGRTAMVAHAVFQVVGYIFFIAAAGLGIWLTQKIKLSNLNLLTKNHPIIGLVVFVLLFFQPLGGILHHLGFRRHGRRTLISHLHIWLGRALVTLGMINGGLGLLLTSHAKRRATPELLRRRHIAYGVFAGVMWLLWVVFAVAGEVRRARPVAKKVVVRNDPPIPRAGPPVRRKDDDLYE